jgi:adenosylcobinamide kinase / adenosylcobinamide-phosphate guanylyltransferase
VALTVLIGGARAGKSSLATRMAESTGLPVVFIATAEAGDKEMEERISRHRACRPAHWTTLEEPLDLSRALELTGPDCAVIVDCLTLWVSNLILRAHDSEDIENRAAFAADIAAQREAPTFVVTNEVGSGVHPNTELGRRFRDLLGRVNAIWTQPTADAFLVVAGRMIVLHRADQL